ncbi:tRNA uridine-5-carboxymethylaminomethyl(34) synthesis GTPase MnmE [Hymenobacter taeanensis]|uniref:tRNA modification GTPase MnmE n=1 Tax=Hymenobacter taeanensis TaxID=2735321 RepID=A0A6M6BKJ8_9BACT|nr:MULTISPECIES: tRNA uridine-5-carboxymethylaminomethyl(34) synthesis GTPase MnmE [Hymenobacter]QJX48550.1 tRNA uridine-5-carboxymethylaminomethyl(34) synthesis GTPase MnmE [Hymenobacter taeanensis]UOQ81953.1 tRNA uridine-5-carboxymethylaminomethyl(34) synthesis GTPase MnmE [Hymenobacter sp. 5414T-23]
MALPLPVSLSDTIVALSTPPGSGAIALVRLSGPQAISITDKVFGGKRLQDQAGHTLHFGTIRDGQRIIDEVVVSLFRGPNSYTKEDVVEISTHGSDFIVQELLALLVRRGARLAEAGEFTKRAFLHGAFDLAQAEAVADLIAADSALSHQVAMQQMRGGFSQELRDLRARLVQFAALLELELDFGEEDVEFADRTGLVQLLQEVQALVHRLLRSFELGNVIKHGVTTVIAGRPNAGKSTLLNALLNEERAIVSEVAGTTRDLIEDEVSLDGIRFRFVDTAGLRDTTDVVESIGVERTKKRVLQAALVVYLFDITTTSPQELQAEIEALQLPAAVPVLAVGNKLDVASDTEIAAFRSRPGTALIAASRGDGLDELRETLLNVVRGEGLDRTGGTTIVTNVRHARSLEQAAQHLDAVLTGLATGSGTELLAADLRHALADLGQITGEISNEDLLTSIFTQFCIGK